MDYTVHSILQARILGWTACPSPADLPDPGIEPGSPAWQADLLPAELAGKNKAAPILPTSRSGAPSSLTWATAF